MKKDFRNLLIWQKAHEIFGMVCEDVKKWPLSNPVARSIAYQILDSAGSMGATIAEGYGRGGSKEFEQFLRYSRGSSAETDNWLYEAMENKLITPERHQQYQEKFIEFHKMLASFIYKLRSQRNSPVP